VPGLPRGGPAAPGRVGEPLIITTTYEPFTYDNRGQQMKHHAKAASSEPTRGPAGGLARILRAVAIRGGSAGAGGSGAPPSILVAGRPRNALVLIALAAAALVLTVSPPALAAGPPVIESFGPANSDNLTEHGAYATRAFFEVAFQLGGSETHWHFEYATSKTGPWTGAGSGTANLAGGTSADVKPENNTGIRHLTPNTIYYLRFAAENASGKAEETFNFKTTPITAPEFLYALCKGSGLLGYPSLPLSSMNGSPHMCGTRPDHTSTDIFAELDTDGAETKYHFEYVQRNTEAEAKTAFENKEGIPVPGAEGAVTVAEDFAQTKEAHLSGLSPETTYYLRAVAENGHGSPATETVEFTTSPEHPIAEGRPEVINVSASTAHVKGAVDPSGFETHWRFEYTTEPGNPFSWTTPVSGASGTILAAEADEAAHRVEGELTGLSQSTAYYVRLFAENGHPPNSTSAVASFETAGPPAVTTFAVHALHGEAMRALGSVRPDGYDTRYHFEYTTTDFASCGLPANLDCLLTPEIDAGPGEFAGGVFPTRIVGADLPNLQPGLTYRYRLVATNTLPATVDGADQTLTVPAAPEPGGEGEPAACPNEALRSGLSARLPDCRAYELLTPVSKEGSQEIFNYGTSAAGGGLVGEDGDHFMLVAPFVNWGGAGSSVGQSPYSFSRTPAGWQMIADSLQPETGVDKPDPRIFSPDLTEFGFETGFNTVGSQSPDFEFKAGAPGGPYTTVASVPRSQVPEGVGGWVAASEDFGKLILEVEDRKLVEPQLRQANVGIGSCGASIVPGSVINVAAGSRRHAVSADGSRVFFEAVPGGNCGEPSHLYMRVGGTETVDIGAYRFLAANAEGTKLLLEHETGATHEVLLYDTASTTAKLLFSEPQGEELHLSVSEDFTALYLESYARLTTEAPAPSSETGFNPQDLYRYDISTGALRFIVQVGGAGGFPGLGQAGSSPDGRYYYFESPSVAGVPGGAPSADGAQSGESRQVYRYDSTEEVVQCMSCASSFDPEPKLGSFFPGGESEAGTPGGVPNATLFSASGDFAFFETPAALVPQDVDGEVEPELGRHEHSSIEQKTSVSSDVYEWRRDGVDGCAHVQGCLALITSGRGGFMNLLIGASPSGRDVFFSTASQLLPQDNDSALDIYDARIGGGFPPPAPRPVECEGDACSTPASAPNDPTPTLLPFSGAVNFVPVATPAPKAKHKAKKKPKKKGKPKKKTKKSNHRRGR
jgi:hypothetical protein